MAEPVPTYREAMRDLIGARWGVLWRALPAAFDPENLEAVHDIRVASRRLRAAMDVAVDAFPAKWYRPMHRAAKEITAALGEVRDRDVLIQGLVAELETASPAERPGVQALIDRVDWERAAARVEMEAYLHRLASSGLPAESVRRFGPAADPGVPAASGDAGKGV